MGVNFNIFLIIMGNYKNYDFFVAKGKICAIMTASHLEGERMP
jgi:hypothetical protein